MPVNINGENYYRTLEVCTKAGVSRATLFRWLRAGVLDRCRRDRRGWRLYSETDLDRICAEANRIDNEDAMSASSGSSCTFRRAG